VVEPERDACDVQDVVLDSGALASRPVRVAGASASGARVVVWTAQRRVLRVSASARSYLVINENFNVGWRASIGGRPLRTVRLDGWKQGWLLPAGTAGVVTLTYGPDRLYHDAIIGGLGAVGLILLLAVAPWAVGALRRAAREARDGAAPGSADGAGGAWGGQRPLTAGRPEHLGMKPHRPGTDAGPVSASADWRSRRLRLDLHLDLRYSSAATWAAVACGLPLTGFWLGGYLGAAILTAVTGLFMTAASYQHSRRYWRELSRPRLLTGLLVVAAACGATGEHLLLAGSSGLLVTALSDTIPQVICLVIVGRLMAALILPAP
jgi:arabinofuranan 3-O-arabinosyltransferase